jgi:anti-sigma B factor antagonist
MSDLRSRTVGSVEVVELAGRFDAHSAPSVVSWLEKHAAATAPQIVVNLRDVTFIDSMALATLVRGMQRLRQRAGDMHLCDLQQPVHIIFELTRLNQALEIFATEAAAINAFATDHR